MFASGRASTTFGRGAGPSAGNPCAQASTLLTASTGARIACRGGRLAFDLTTSVIRGRLEQISAFQSVPATFFVGGTVAAAWGGAR